MNAFSDRHTIHARMLVFAACGVLTAGLAGINWLLQLSPLASRPPGVMLLAPMVGVIDSCILQPLVPGNTYTASTTSANDRCTGPQGSAAAMVESTLSQLQPKGKKLANFPLGYTLPVPLLQLFHSPNGTWIIDQERVQRLVRTVRDTERPLILYLFSTHFATHAPIEEALALNPTNLAQTRDGPLPVGKYYNAPIYPWTFASTETDITVRRLQATHALLNELCRLPAHDLAKIRGVTLLGELHHLFPDFQGGMGFTAPYRITDYSQISIAGFRQYLVAQFKNIERLNRILGTNYANFTEIFPPSRDIRTEPLQHFAEHIDSFAHGSLPIAGWAYVPGRSATTTPAWIHIYLNGAYQGKTPVNHGRQDVLKAKPEFHDANTGWRFDLDFRRLTVGLHRIDVFLESRPGQLLALGERHIAIMDKHQRTPAPQPLQPLPEASHIPSTVQAHIDMPTEQSSYYYNPLVPEWHTFRGRQIVTYLRIFDDVIRKSCLANTPRYTHQIVPFANPGWDTHKFAIDASLRPLEGVRLGVSLYGDAAYGPGFARWYKAMGHHSYGITEFHPLKALDAPELHHVLTQHAERGAQFLSFFLEPYLQGHQVARDHNQFSLDPNNMQYGSAQLYHALQNDPFHQR